MEFFRCPYLGRAVELTDEREQHIASRHTILLPGRMDYSAHTLCDPDVVILKINTDNNFVFGRWFLELDKYTLVAVIRDVNRRCWIVTAYVARRLPKGETLWRRNI